MTLPCRKEPVITPVSKTVPAFKPLTLAEKEEIDCFTRHFPKRTAGFTFQTLFSWTPVYKYEWLVFSNTLFIRCELYDGTGKHFLQPVGDFGTDAQDFFIQLLREKGKGVRIFGVDHDFISRYPAFCDHFDLLDDQDLRNYLYRTENLATLAGKAYAKKRNLIAQAAKAYSYTVEPLTQHNAADCNHILDNLDIDDPEGWARERSAIDQALRSFSASGQSGLLLRIDGKPAAFSVYHQLTPDTALVSFEKAVGGYKGLYQIVNRETAQAIAARGIPFINREEDMGIPGLRQAKLSYHPVDMVPSMALTLR